MECCTERELVIQEHLRVCVSMCLGWKCSSRPSSRTLIPTSPFLWDRTWEKSSTVSPCWRYIRTTCMSWCLSSSSSTWIYLLSGLPCKFIEMNVWLLLVSVVLGVYLYCSTVWSVRYHNGSLHIHQLSSDKLTNQLLHTAPPTVTFQFI